MGLPRALRDKITKDLAVMLRPHKTAVCMFEQYVEEATAYYKTQMHAKARLIHRLKYLYRQRVRKDYNMNCPAGSFNKKAWRWTNDNYWARPICPDHYPRFYQWAENLRSIGWEYNDFPIKNAIDSNGDLTLLTIKIPDQRRIYGNKRLQGLLLVKAFWIMRQKSKIELLMDEHKFKSYSDKRKFTGALRSYILKKAKHRCEHCGSRNELEIDHKIPWSKGGKTTIANSRVLCRACNIGIYHLEQKMEHV